MKYNRSDLYCVVLEDFFIDEDGHEDISIQDVVSEMFTTSQEAEDFLDAKALLDDLDENERYAVYVLDDVI